MPLFLLLVACPSPFTDGVPRCDPDLRARLITSDSVPAANGLMNTARPGDVLLENGVIQAVIQGPGRAVATNPFGGNLIDVDWVREEGGSRDAFAELGTFVNLAGTSSADRVYAVPNGCSEVRVRAEGSYVLSDYINLKTGASELLPGILDGLDLNQIWPLAFQIDYVLEPKSSVVRVEATVRNEGSETVPASVSWLIDAGPVDASIPAVNSYELDTIGLAEYFIFDGRDQSYGVLPVPEERNEARGYVSLVGGYSLTHELSFAELLGFPDTVEQLSPGEELRADLLFVVGRDHADVARQIRAALGEESCVDARGTVVDGAGQPVPRAYVTAIEGVDGEEGIDLAHTRSDETGAWSMCLPTGAVRLIAGARGYPYAGGADTPQRVAVTVSDDMAAVSLALPSTGQITAAVTDTQGAPLPARLVIMGVDPSPHSHRLSGLGFDPFAPGVVAAHDEVDGTFSFALEPGEYDAVFSRGPEYSAVVTPVTVSAGDTVALSATLHRVVDTAGYVSGDFHVHAQASPDSTRTNVARVANMAAEGVEILVSTDHDFVTDFTPAVEELSAQSYLVTFPGEEITSFDYGHFNAFPLPIDHSSPNNGAVEWSGRTPTEIGEEVLSSSSPRVFQLNHPRKVPAPGVGGNYFEVIDLIFDAQGPRVGPNATLPETMRLPAGSDVLATSFTAMEVITWMDVQGLHDWYNFINAGLFFTATGNSDTHTQYVESSGWPRNYVKLGVDAPSEVTADALAIALNAGKNTVGFGPFVTLSAQGAGSAEIGDTVVPDGQGDVTVTVRVQAPVWVPFDSVVLWDGAAGEVLAGGAVSPLIVSAGPAPEAERYEVSFEHRFSPGVDTWLIALVQGQDDLFPVFPYNTEDELTLAEIRADAVEGGATAFAITNPIWVDADQDGEITANHLVLPPDHAEWRWENRTNPY